MPPNAQIPDIRSAARGMFDKLQAKGQATLGKGFRFSRYLQKLQMPDLLLKVPRDVGVDEENVSFGMGLTGVIAAGGIFTLTQAAPRECILRDLVVQAFGGAAGANDWEFLITSISIEGKNVYIGGQGPGKVFDAASLCRPEFDLPVAGGCQVQVVGNNTSAGNRQYSAHWRID